MSDYDNTNSFVLFINDKKTKDADDRSADRTGTLNVGGVEYFMDGWIRQGKKGPFLSGKIKKKQQQAGGRANDDGDADSPF